MFIDEIMNINNSMLIAEFLQATKIYYLTVKRFLTGNLLLSNLRYISSHIKREHDMYSFVGRDILHNNWRYVKRLAIRRSYVGK